MIEGLSHITLIVRDLNAMEKILTTLFNAKKVYDSGSDAFSLTPERFFLIGELWIATMQGDSLPTKTYNHIAFKIKDEEFQSYLDKVTALGLDMRQSRPRVKGEGRSIYFYDDDNHMFELHTGTLAERLARYAAAPITGE